MTIGVFVLCALTSILILGMFAFLYFEVFDDLPFIRGIIFIFTAIILVAVWVSGGWYCSSTAAGQRAMKTQKSEFGSGIERELTIYDIDGDIIEHYKGKFDIDFSSDQRIVFDDEQKVRHVIYPGSGIVVVNEILE